MKLLHYDTLHPFKIGDLRAKVIIGVRLKNASSCLALMPRAHPSGLTECRFREVFNGVLLGTILPLCAG